MRLRKRNKLVFGVGLNDADYNVYQYSNVGGCQSLIASCVFYVRWQKMLQRCYSERYLLNRPSYRGCSVVPHWLKFSNFKNWMERQDFEGKDLDKDLLFFGNRVYGPLTCIFIEPQVNSFMLERKTLKGNWPIGVSFHKNSGRFRASCKNPFTNREAALGYFDSADLAHLAWKAFKLEKARELASQMKDPRAAKALIDRYLNYPEVYP